MTKVAGFIRMQAARDRYEGRSGAPGRPGTHPIMRFWLDICLGGIKLGDTVAKGKKVSPEEALLVRSAYAAMEAVKELVFSAAEWSGAT